MWCRIGRKFLDQLNHYQLCLFIWGGGREQPVDVYDEAAVVLQNTATRIGNCYRVDGAL